MTAYTTNTDLTRAEQACAEGESALTQADTGTAESRFREALGLVGVDPGDTAAHGAGNSDLGGFREGPGPDGESVARVAARALTGVGRVLLARGEVDRAVGEFERARTLRPAAAGPLHWLGCATARQGDLGAAERHFTASLGCAVPHGRSLVQRAYVHARAGDRDAALADLRAASLAAPLDDEARWVLAVLSGRSVREVALRLRRAAVASLAGLGERRGPTDAEEWERAGQLIAAARGLDRAPLAFAPLHAVALVRAGRRETAVELLKDAVRHDPADHRVTHALALALLNSPDLEGQEKREEQEEREGQEAQEAQEAQEVREVREKQAANCAWEPCVAAWAAVLHDAGFWARVRATAARRYGVAVEDSLVPVLRAGLREALERRMPGDEAAGTRVAPGPLLQREADAAKLLAAVGGFPSAEGGGVPLFCGPLRIAELGRSAEFGAFAAAQDESDAYASLTYAFSELGFAQLLLGQDKAADALAALSELRCQGCRAGGSATGAAAVCEPGCARFDELNPGYAGLPDKHRRLSLDARGLALEARLVMGRTELTSTRPDFGAAAAYWRRALVHGRELERYRETQTAIVDMALGAARAAHREGRLSLAVSTLETTRSVIGANERARLEGQLARVLADRGISVANDEEALLDQPAADLRRSVAFNPHLLRAQVSLGVVLRGLAAARWTSGSLRGARDTLREAIDQLTAALALFPDDPDLEEQREAAVSDLNLVMWQPDVSEQ